MGEQDSGIPAKAKMKVHEALEKVSQMLEDCAYTDGRPTELYIRVRGASEQSMTFELEDLSEALEILRLNS